MTGPPDSGDDDPVAQFSDPELRHGYAEYPTGGFPTAPAGPSAPGGSVTRRSSRRRLLALLIIVIILAAVAGLVASLAH